VIVLRAFVVAALAAIVTGAAAFADAPSVPAATPPGGPVPVPAPALTAAEADPPRLSSGTWRHGESAVGVLFGVGWYDNDDFNQDLAFNGIDPIENGFEYGLQYRHRISRWVSIGAELGRMDGRTNPPDSNSEYGIAATPLLVDVFVHPLQVDNASLTLFGSIGPLIATRLGVTFSDGSVLEGSKGGLCTQGGAEGEMRFGPNFGFFLRGLVRRAEAKEVAIDDGSGAEPTIYDVDFNGTAVTFGPRWYFGGTDR
jgi:hypothetical protein